MIIILGGAFSSAKYPREKVLPVKQEVERWQSRAGMCVAQCRGN